MPGFALAGSRSARLLLYGFLHIADRNMDSNFVCTASTAKTLTSDPVAHASHCSSLDVVFSTTAIHMHELIVQKH
jgi:hypothetical protein